MLDGRLFWLLDAAAIDASYETILQDAATSNLQGSPAKASRCHVAEVHLPQRQSLQQFDAKRQALDHLGVTVHMLPADIDQVLDLVPGLVTIVTLVAARS